MVLSGKTVQLKVENSDQTISRLPPVIYHALRFNLNNNATVFIILVDVVGLDDRINIISLLN